VAVSRILRPARSILVGQAPRYWHGTGERRLKSLLLAGPMPRCGQRRRSEQLGFSVHLTASEFGYED
jgi:hypothetical protein